MIIHGASVIIVNKNSEVLMLHRDNNPKIFWPDYWTYIGGDVNENENFETAARRELKEETNYIADILYPLAEEEYTRDDEKAVMRHVFWTMYDEKQEVECLEGKEIKFLKLEELKNKKLTPGTERLLYLAIEKAKEKGFL
jgi:8-oxo-dGTP diphosphatase